ncbi:Arrestin-like, N-terminal [Penicillium italicum]|uniref:Arrestin-like, N-terminal n=1 Tax=Penicillium italicum TaxID=40296 RepID=A0A0A2LCD3_PENIT|nr:Arrestin-like, N-terminal [Penicillium italicum]
MSTATSIVSSGSDRLDAWTRRNQPKIEIHVDGQKPGLVNSYTTGESIDGSVTVTVDHETRFDEIKIEFEGVSTTTVERTSCPGRTGSQQMFLKLRQPIDEMEYPTPRVLESGRSYVYRFTFVIPDRLLPQACTHAEKHAHIQRAHTLLPPTLGDPILASNGKTLLDDMAPSMSQIGYTVRASVLQKQLAGSGVVAIAGIAKKVRIIPVVEEEPPVETSASSSYCTRKEKSVKRGTLRGKLGRIVASSSQPKPIQLLPPDGEPTDTVSTVAAVNLRFDPVGDEQPPPLGAMTSKLRANTFFSATPWDDFPSTTGIPFSRIGCGLYTECVPLLTMCVASAQWTKHSTAADYMRRDSTDSSSSDSSTGPSSAFTGDIYYTASIVVPITLPKSKAFIPTFHSCLMSRTYALDLSLTYHTPAANLMTPTISLRLPVQFTSQATRAEPIKTALDVTVTQQELDEFFQPRNVTSPTGFSNHTRSDVVNVGFAPPEYSERVSTPRAGP